MLRPTPASIICAGEDLEGEAELEEQLVLPLLDQAARRDDQAALHVLAEDQLLDVEPGHDRLAGTRVVGEQEPQRGARQQLAVDRPDLVRQRLHVAGGHREHRVVESGQLDSLRLGDELEVGRFGVEGATAGCCDRQLLLIAPEQHLLAQVT